ncbi:hypothetical protein LZ30DRAFT_722428 [Colletotrichum cereale]|nr:hypothetical protein LZ30DRAFT_722428 [Colletotrichum cereale]
MRLGATIVAAISSQSRLATFSTSLETSSPIYTSAPNQGILFYTATECLQGTHPPFANHKAQIAMSTFDNGGSSISPLETFLKKRRPTALAGVHGAVAEKSSSHSDSSV